MVLLPTPPLGLAMTMTGMFPLKINVLTLTFYLKTTFLQA